MANITWSVVTTDGTVTQDSPTLSDANMARFIDWVWYAYPQIDVTDPENPVPKPRNLANEADATRDWMAKQWNTTKNNVLRWERQEAAQAAEAGVADL